MKIKDARERIHQSTGIFANSDATLTGRVISTTNTSTLPQTWTVTTNPTWTITTTGTSPYPYPSNGIFSIQGISYDPISFGESYDAFASSFYLKLKINTKYTQEFLHVLSMYMVQKLDMLLVYFDGKLTLNCRNMLSTLSILNLSHDIYDKSLTLTFVSQQNTTKYQNDQIYEFLEDLDLDWYL